MHVFAAAASFDFLAARVCFLVYCVQCFFRSYYEFLAGAPAFYTHRRYSCFTHLCVRRLAHARSCRRKSTRAQERKSARERDITNGVRDAKRGKENPEFERKPRKGWKLEMFSRKETNKATTTTTTTNAMERSQLKKRQEQKSTPALLAG